MPKDKDQGEIIEFLCRSGLSEDKKDNITFKTNGAIVVKNLTDEESKSLIDAIHGKKFFGRKLFCNGIVPLTPEKPEESQSVTEKMLPEHEDPYVKEPPAVTVQHTDDSSSSSTAAPSSQPASSSAPSPSYIAALQTFQLADQGVILQPFSLDFNGGDRVARRHSLSLLNRTPPNGSLAAEIMSTQSTRPEVLKTKSILNELKGLSEQLSDFGSCISSSDSSNDDTEDEIKENEGFKSMNEKRRNKKSKRKLKLTPGKEDFLKKPNLVFTN